MRPSATPSNIGAVVGRRTAVESFGRFVQGDPADGGGRHRAACQQGLADLAGGQLRNESGHALLSVGDVARRGRAVPTYSRDVQLGLAEFAQQVTAAGVAGRQAGDAVVIAPRGSRCRRGLWFSANAAFDDARQFLLLRADRNRERNAWSPDVKRQVAAPVEETTLQVAVQRVGGGVQEISFGGAPQSSRNF